MERTIFLAAIEDELIPFKSHLKQQRSLGGREIDFIEVGVGVINSIINLNKKIESLSKIDWIILIGTAGIIGKRFAPGKIYQASVFRWGCVGMALSKGYLPESLYPDLPARVVKDIPQGIEEIPVITTPEITSSEEGASALKKQYGPGLENLEAYGIARLFKSYNLSISAFFSVTNRVGQESHQQYLKYRELAWENLAKTVYNIIKQKEKI
jgi:hypothetical protein